MTVKEVRKLVAYMRAHKVQSFSVGDLQVTFSDTAHYPDVVAERAPPPDDDDAAPRSKAKNPVDELLFASA